MRSRALISALALAAAACSTAPEDQSPHVARLCYVNSDPRPWSQIAPPDNADAYRRAWAAPNGRDAYETPRWPAGEFWFRLPTGETKLCTGRPFHREDRCSDGTTTDYRETAEGLVATSSGEPVCIL